MLSPMCQVCAQVRENRSLKVGKLHTMAQCTLVNEHWMLSCTLQADAAAGVECYAAADAALATELLLLLHW